MKDWFVGTNYGSGIQRIWIKKTCLSCCHHVSHVGFDFKTVSRNVSNKHFEMACNCWSIHPIPCIYLWLCYTFMLSPSPPVQVWFLCFNCRDARNDHSISQLHLTGIRTIFVIFRWFFLVLSKMGPGSKYTQQLDSRRFFGAFSTNLFFKTIMDFGGYIVWQMWLKWR